MTETTADAVKRIMRNSLGADPDALTNETKVGDIRDTDSLDAIELSLALEDELDVSIEDDAITLESTFGQIVDLIDGLRA